TATGAAALNQNLPVPRGGDRAAALTTVARTLVDRYEDRWKRDNIVAVGAVGSALRVVVPISSYADWIELRRRLRSVALVRDVHVLELTRDRARLELDYTGDVNQLRVALAQSDLTLAPAPFGTEATPGDYTLSLAGASMAPAESGAVTEPAVPGTEPAAPGPPSGGGPAGQDR